MNSFGIRYTFLDRPVTIFGDTHIVSLMGLLDKYLLQISLFHQKIVSALGVQNSDSMSNP